MVSGNYCYYVYKCPLFLSRHISENYRINMCGCVDGCFGKPIVPGTLDVCNMFLEFIEKDLDRGVIKLLDLLNR